MRRSKPPLPRDASGRVMSRGRQRLNEHLQGMTILALARMTGLSKSEISRLRGGVPTDSYHTRETLEHYLGISMRLWDEPPERESSDSQSRDTSGDIKAA